MSAIDWCVLFYMSFWPSMNKTSIYVDTLHTTITPMRRIVGRSYSSPYSPPNIARSSSIYNPIYRTPSIKSTPFKLSALSMILVGLSFFRYSFFFFSHCSSIRWRSFEEKQISYKSAEENLQLYSVAHVPFACWLWHSELHMACTVCMESSVFSSLSR